MKTLHLILLTAVMVVVFVLTASAQTSDGPTPSRMYRAEDVQNLIYHYEAQIHDYELLLSISRGQIENLRAELEMRQSYEVALITANDKWQALCGGAPQKNFWAHFRDWFPIAAAATSVGIAATK